jgi:hypothetical protein
MTMPGFTAEASLLRGPVSYRGMTHGQPPDRRVSPAQSVFTSYAAYLGGIGLRWPILEPNCILLCLRAWGGYFRWICY